MEYRPQNHTFFGEKRGGETRSKKI